MVGRRHDPGHTAAGADHGRGVDAVHAQLVLLQPAEARGPVALPTPQLDRVMAQLALYSQRQRPWWLGGAAVEEEVVVAVVEAAALARHHLGCRGRHARRRR